MKTIACIPARYAASRFPAKLIQMLGDKTVIRHTYDNTVATGLFDEVFVITDSDIIYKEITEHGGKAVMSIKEHESGSDRIAEGVENMDVEIILNVQGDEPFVNKDALAKLLALFTDEKVQVASLMQQITEDADIQNPNNVKVVVDKQNNSLLFSRSVIPHPRSVHSDTKYFHHIGVYAFRKAALLNFTKWQPTPLELTEKIECLRYLENGIQLKMAETKYMGVQIDTPEDLEKAKAYLKSLS